MNFIWDQNKSYSNLKKHGVSFDIAQVAFADRNRVIQRDVLHSEKEERYFCYGKLGDEILTVRFTIRDGMIRIIGAGFWRKGKGVYFENQAK